MPRREEAKRRILAQWLSRARSHLGVAEHLVGEGSLFPSAAVFHCQQAVEKLIKAFLTWNEIDFPKMHDLKQLLDLAASINQRLADELRQVIALTLYGVELRYPGDRPEASPDEARRALTLARQVYDTNLPLLPDLSANTGG